MEMDLNLKLARQVAKKLADYYVSLPSTIAGFTMTRIAANSVAESVKRDADKQREKLAQAIADIDTVGDLIGAIRNRVALQNEAVGVNALVAEAANLQRKMEAYQGLTSCITSTAEELVPDEKLRAHAEMVITHLKDSVTASRYVAADDYIHHLTEAQKVGFRRNLNQLRRQHEAVMAKIASLNASTHISVSKEEFETIDRILPGVLG